MKIALLTDGIYPYVIGGIQRHSFYLCKYLAKKGVYVDLYHTESESNKYDVNLLEFFTEKEREFIKPIFVPFPKHKKIPGHYIRESYQYSTDVYNLFLLNKTNIDFVYSKNYTGWKYIEEKESGADLPPIGVNLHGYEIYQYTDSLRDQFNILQHKKPTVFNTVKADYVFSYGKGITDLLLSNTKVKPQNIIEIPTGISQEWLRKVEEIKVEKEALTFIFIGRYTKRKGIHFISKFIKSNLDLDFNVEFIGPIPKNKQLNDKRVVYHGQLSDSSKIKKLVDEADVLLCPSYSEGMPNVIMEGMARGCAILGTDVGAVSDMVSNENGWLIEGGSYKAFELCMNNILQSSKETVLNKKKRSIELVNEKFLWSKICDQLLASISDILK